MRRSSLLNGILVLAAASGGGWITGRVARDRLGTVTAVPDEAAARTLATHAGLAAGTPSAPHVVRVFGDYECPACRALEDAAGDSLRALARAGLLQFVYIHAPLRGHPRGVVAAAAAYCASAMGKGWAMHGALYATAPRWGSGPPPDDVIGEVAHEMLGDTAGFGACMTAPQTRDRVAADTALAEILAIRAVPTVYFDGDRLENASPRSLLRYITRRAGRLTVHPMPRTRGSAIR